MMDFDESGLYFLTAKGKIEELGAAGLQDLFEKNPYMEDIYPSEESRSARLYLSYMKEPEKCLIYQNCHRRFLLNQR